MTQNNNNLRQLQESICTGKLTTPSSTRSHHVSDPVSYHVLDDTVVAALVDELCLS